MIELSQPGTYITYIVGWASGTKGSLSDMHNNVCSNNNITRLLSELRLAKHTEIKAVENLYMSHAFLTQVVELKPGGKDIPVITANRIAYIHLVADYRLNKQIRPHCLAFRQGLANVVNLEWLRMFDQQEIQVPCT